ncbi:HD domain-containing protein [Chloroflexota bacterium]
MLKEVAEYLSRRGVAAYLVGGYVRDLLLGRETADVDIAVHGAPEIARDIGRAFKGKFVLLDEISQVARVVIPPSGVSGPGWHLDLSPLKGDIEHNLAQRDFTINAMAVELTEGVEKGSRLAIIDPWGGQRDLGQRLLRVVKGTVFQDDALRLLRAVRLAAELGLAVDMETEVLIRRDSHLISGVSGERVREELLRLLALPGADRRLSYLDSLSLLTAIIPELAQAKGVEQPREHHWDVFQHSIETVGAVEGVLREGPWEYGGEDIINSVPVFQGSESYFHQEVARGSSRLILLKLAALLHDVAKPQTKTVEEGGRTRFLGHTGLGAEKTESILERLRFSNREVKMMTTMVKYHLRPGQMSQEGMPTRRAIYRYFRDTEGVGIDILYLSLADFLASRGPEIDSGEWREFTGLVDYVLSRQGEVEQASPPKVVDGNDLMRLFDLKPGPELGRLLEQVKEAQAAGELGNREEALEFVGKILS